MPPNSLVNFTKYSLPKIFGDFYKIIVYSKGECVSGFLSAVAGIPSKNTLSLATSASYMLPMTSLSRGIWIVFKKIVRPLISTSLIYAARY
jgi:hypothetical protein